MLTSDRSVMTEGRDLLADDNSEHVCFDDAPAPTKAAHPELVTILYATETGASEDVANALLCEAEGLDLTVTLQDVADFDLDAFSEVEVLLFITSTTGDGEVPYTAENFFEMIEGEDRPDLSSLRYAVLALGDSTYEQFCEAGKRLDRALVSAGAERILDRVDCDVDYEDTAAKWRGDVLAKLVGANSRQRSYAASLARSDERSQRFVPVAATVVENLLLTGPGSSKATRHIVLEFAGEPPAYAPGDALGLIPQNDEGVVDALLEALSFDPASQICSNGTGMILAQAMRELYEIAVVTPQFIEGWSKLSGSPALRALQTDDQARITFMRENHVIDIVREHPVLGLTVDQFIALLRPMQPRLYSIASSQRMKPREVHLTVAPVEYELHRVTRRGVATGQLALRAPVGSQIHVYIQSNKHFRLPSPATPIIMIGPGTGIAPFRAFLQDRSQEVGRGDAWLFFGERNQATDFLYQQEIAQYLADGTLTRVDTAFSRDGSDKIYVQHRIAEQTDEIVAWIDAGAHLYICGDARMASDVHEALVTAIARRKRLEMGAAEGVLNAMRREKRYQRDVY